MITSIPCLRQKSKNPKKHTLASRTSPLSPYKGVPPWGHAPSTNTSGMFLGSAMQANPAPTMAEFDFFS